MKKAPKLVAVGKFIPIGMLMEEFGISAFKVAKLLRRQFFRRELRALCRHLEIPEGRLKRVTSARIAHRLQQLSRGEAKYRHIQMSAGINLRLEARRKA